MTSCGGTDMCGEGMAVIPTGPENVTAGMKDAVLLG